MYINMLDSRRVRMCNTFYKAILATLASVKRLGYRLLSYDSASPTSTGSGRKRGPGGVPGALRVALAGRRGPAAANLFQNKNGISFTICLFGLNFRRETIFAHFAPDIGGRDR